MEEGNKVMKSRFRRVCVFCGSSSGKRNSYQTAAVELGEELVARKVNLVYGGGSVGLMGLVSEAVHKGGGHDNSHHSNGQRGGYGTLEELLEVIAWAQLGIHSKPVGLLNVDGYYNFLLAFIDKAVDDGFIQPLQRHLFVAATNAKDLVQKLEDYVPAAPDAAVAKLRWEMEQVEYNSALHAEIAR
ncbi:Cytokinin riboside 5'-monophosphate phosphoribohydrolase LOG5 [Ananas comosus]|uniref:cytokinin riboside 5'-monophosphate phosphoribohydrolase n=1 Tax=Ananas comosus TaxID=4615 RepID=A0A199URR7_ANACO|nr:Cytokinin riboside 5'-monophosphate phosphoribohydrolase LOG5 [Ananas comosus]